MTDMNERIYVPLSELVTEEQLANIVKLRDHLKRYGVARNFHMGFFGATPINGLSIEEINVEDDNTYTMIRHPHHAATSPSACGSVACMVGHAPSAGIPALDDESYWWEYVERVFGSDMSDDPIWVWLFSEEWAYTDNTLAGGISRLTIAIEKGIPSDADEQLHREVPLEYA